MEAEEPTLWLQGWNFSSTPLPPGRGEGLNQSPMANDLIDCAFVMKPPLKKTKKNRVQGASRLVNQNTTTCTGQLYTSLSNSKFGSCQVGSLKSAVVRVFTPQKSSNTTNQGFPPPSLPSPLPQPVVKHLATHYQLEVTMNDLIPSPRLALLCTVCIYPISMVSLAKLYHQVPDPN